MSCYSHGDYTMKLKRNKSHGFGAMHIKEMIKTKHVHLKS